MELHFRFFIWWSEIFLCEVNVWSGNRYSKEIRNHLHFHLRVFCVCVCVVVIECDEVCCEGWGPLALPLCVCCVCRLARRLVECRTVLLLPSWRVAWAGEARKLGTRRCTTQGSMECVLELIFVCLWQRKKKIEFHSQTYFLPFKTLLLAFLVWVKQTTQLAQHQDVIY